EFAPAHRNICFRVQHPLFFNVKGECKTVAAAIGGPDSKCATFTATIAASGIYTNYDDRDAHLKSADFFEAENYPEITFTGTSLKRKDDDEYELTGNLTIKGTTRELTLDLEFGGYMKDPYGNEKAGFSVEGKLNRKDLGLNWNAALEAGGVMVGNEVKLNAELQFVKQEA